MLRATRHDIVEDIDAITHGIAPRVGADGAELDHYKVQGVGSSGELISCQFDAQFSASPKKQVTPVRCARQLSAASKCQLNCHYARASTSVMTRPTDTNGGVGAHLRMRMGSPRVTSGSRQIWIRTFHKFLLRSGAPAGAWNRASALFRRNSMSTGERCYPAERLPCLNS